MSPFKTYRVRFCEWQTFAVNISARTPGEAIELASTLRENHGTEPFEELDGGTEGWEAGEVQP
jgi:hypothetical protein